MAILDDVKAYLASIGVTTGAGTRYTDAVLNQVITTELAAQSRKCDGAGGLYPDLNEALCRRVYVNLSKRALGLGLTEASGDADVSRFRVSSRDPEITRLEAPYRKASVR